MTPSAKPLYVLLVPFCTALRFLTLLPISWRAAEDPQQFKRCLIFFPVVGALIGAIGCLGAWAVSLFLPPPVVAVLALIYLAFISGFLHLDGLADSADGLLSSRPREDCLRIMKDSRAGAMGVIAVVCLMLVKYSALSSMAPENFYPALFFMPLAGRSAILLTMARLPYARPEGGLGGLFYSQKSRKAAIAACFILLLLLTIVAPAQLFIVAIAVLVTNLIFGRWCRNQLGGATGDTLGAVCEITEAVTAVAFSAFFPFS